MGLKAVKSCSYGSTSTTYLFTCPDTCRKMYLLAAMHSVTDDRIMSRADPTAYKYDRLTTWELDVLTVDVQAMFLRLAGWSTLSIMGVVGVVNMNRSQFAVVGRPCYPPSRQVSSRQQVCDSDDCRL